MAAKLRTGLRAVQRGGEKSAAARDFRNNTLSPQRSKLHKRQSFFREDQASFSHFAMKLFFAAPESGLPSLLTALLSQASSLHFFTKLFLAAPASALPSLLTALISQAVCAIAEPMAKDVIKAARIIRFTLRLHL